MHVGISTGGGDCPGLNAVIRAFVRCAVLEYGWEVTGIQDGLGGLLEPNKLTTLSPQKVRGLISRGGTILGSTNRGNPFSYPVEGPTGVELRDVSDRVVKRAEQLGLDALVFVGGDGTQSIALQLSEKGMNVVGVPKTIDNDLAATDYTFGFDTACNVAMEALDRLKTTAESHDRIMVVEVMGRQAGWIALHAGLAGAASIILLPEIPYSLEAVEAALLERRANGLSHAIVVVAEGARVKHGEASYSDDASAGAVRRLQGAGIKLATALAERGFETRATVLGHIQRGGTPSHMDRVLSSRFGVEAAHMIAERRFGRMVCLHGTAVCSVPIEDALDNSRGVDPKGQLVATARSLGVCLGD